MSAPICYNLENKMKEKQLTLVLNILYLEMNFALQLADSSFLIIRRFEMHKTDRVQTQVKNTS